MKRTVYAIELSAYSPALSAETTLYYASPGINTLATDTPANTHFAPRIISPGSFSQFLVSPLVTDGNTRVGYGNVVLNNADGALDFLQTYGLDGRRLVIRRGLEGAAYPAQYTTLLVATMEQIEFNWSQVIIILRDRQGEIASQVYQPTKYAGTNALPDGVEGVATDLLGKPKPVLRGTVLNISPPLVNSSKLTYQLSTLRIDSIDAVYVGGEAVSAGTEHYSLAALQAATPSGGTYDYYRGLFDDGAFLRLGTTPDKTVTVDASEGLARTRTNLISYSQEADNAAWTKNLTSIGANAGVAPDGTTTADNLISNTSSSTGHVMYRDSTRLDNQNTVFSVYLKNGGRRYCRIQLTDSTTSSGGTNTTALPIDVNTGALGTLSATGAAVVYDYGIEDIGNGWWRAWLAVNLGGAGAQMNCQVRNSASLASNSHAGNDVDGILVWGMQVEAGLEVTDYIPTTSGSASVNDAASNTAAQISQAIMLAAGLEESDIDSAAVVALDALNDAPLGIWAGTEENRVSAMLDEVLGSIGAHWWIRSDGLFTMGRLDEPSGAADFTIHDYEIFASGQRIERLRSRSRDGGLPAWRLKLGYQKNYTPQSDGDLATSVTQARRGFLKEGFRINLQEDAGVKTKHLLAVEKEVTTLLVDAADAAVEAARQFDIYQADHDFLRVSLPAAHFSDVDIALGKVAELRADRFDWSSGKLLLVVGVTYDFSRNETTVELWG